MDVAKLISDFGFPVVATVGLGYFIYYVWNYMNVHVKPELGKTVSYTHLTLPTILLV